MIFEEHQIERSHIIIEKHENRIDFNTNGKQISLIIDQPQYVLRVPRIRIESNIIRDYWGEGSAARALLGLVETVNTYIAEESRSVYMDLDTEFTLLVNCNEADVAKTLDAPLASDQLEFSASNNVLNWLLPYAYEPRFNSIVKRVIKFHLQYFKYLDEYGLRMARGKFKLTQEPEILDQLSDPQQFTKPNFELIEGNLLRFTSGIFVQFEDYTNKTLNDLAIAPVDIILDLKLSENGLEYVKTEIVFKKCQFIQNSKIIDLPEIDDDEDFDDENENSSGQRKIKSSNFQKLACGLIGMIPEAIKNNNGPVQEHFKAITDTFTGLTTNKKPVGESYTLLCAGIDVDVPSVTFEGDRVIFRTQLNKTQERPKEFCNLANQELFKVDPATINSKHMKKLIPWIKFENYNEYFHYLLDHARKGIFEASDTQKHSWSPLIQRLISHYPLQDFCREKFPDLDAQRCAFTVAQFKPHTEYDRLLNDNDRKFKSSDHEDFESVLDETDKDAYYYPKEGEQGYGQYFDNKIHWQMWLEQN